MENLDLQHFKEIPDGFLEISATEIHTILSGPSLIELDGKKNKPLFISILLHGNETTGLYALQKVLKQYKAADTQLPRNLIIFVGNIAAAKHGLRKLDDQPDYNRIWDKTDAPEGKIMQQVIRFARRKHLFANLDIHNNTGVNPFYSCSNKLNNQHLNLAKLYSKTITYFSGPLGVQSIKFSQLCPSLTIESGQSDDQKGIDKVANFIDVCLNLKKIPTNTISKDEVEVLEHIAILKIPDDASLSFDMKNTDSDITIMSNVEELNFKDVKPNTLLGFYNNESKRIIVEDIRGTDISEQFLEYENNEIRTKQPVVPSMICTSEKIIHQDCWGYLMVRKATTWLL